MFIADLQIYSTFSSGKLAIPEIVDLCGARGFGAIAITDQLCESRTVLGKAAVYMNRTLTPAVFPLYMEIIKSESLRALKKYNMVVIPGVEVTKSAVTDQRTARVIALGVSNYISADQSVREICVAAQNQGAITVGGYTPRLWQRRERLIPYIDAWEVANGRKLLASVVASDLPKLASSAMRGIKHMNSWKTVFSCDRNPQAILNAIKKQEVAFTYYDEVTNDIFNFFGTDDVGSNLQPDADGYVFDAKTFSLKALRRQRRLTSVSSDKHLKAIERRRDRNARKSRKLFHSGVSDI